jgi:hypothetical protein
MAFLLNRHDRTVGAAPALELARNWTSHGAAVHAVELPDSLRLPHDVVDPRHTGENVQAVYPVLKALVRGDQPPAYASSVSIVK